MPRYDDRLSNVLDLLYSGEQNNSDTVFRHISDILVQESAWMDAERRAILVGHLVDIYPKTTQPARMEVMDIAAQVADAPLELVKIAASDSTLVGTRLWDRVRLPSASWQAVLPSLPKPILGRLRARLDLPDDVVVSIDRAWRERLKSSEFTAPSLYDTLTALIAPPAKSAPTQSPSDEADAGDGAMLGSLDEDDEILELQPAPGDETGQIQSAPQMPPVQSEPARREENANRQSRQTAGRQNIFERAFEESLERGDAAFFEETPQMVGPRDQEFADPAAMPPAPDAEDQATAESGRDPGSLLFVPSQDDERTQAADIPAPKDEAVGDDEPIDLTNVLTPAEATAQDVERSQQDEKTDAPVNTPAARILEFPQDTNDANRDDNAAAANDAPPAREAAQTDELLQDKPQVEDPKIQDILARLREFDSRSKRLAMDAAAQESVDQTTPDAATPEAVTLDAATPDLPTPDVPTSEQAPAPSDEEEEPLSVVPENPEPLFLADQPDEMSTQPPPAGGTQDVSEGPQEEETPAQEAVFSASTQARFQPVTVHGATWVTDRFGSLVECASGLGAAFGIATGDAAGLILSTLFVKTDQKKLDVVLHARRAFRDIRATAAADGTTWMLSAVAIFDEESGIFLGHRGTARSITLDLEDAAPATPTLQPQLTPNEPLDMASLAHELKTPLNAIRGFAEMIETEQLGPASAFARDRSQKIGQEADQLNQVLNDLLQPKIAQSDPSAQGAPVHSLLEAALARYAPHLTIEGLNTVGFSLTTHMRADFLASLVEKMVHASALWTPAHSTVHIAITQEGPATINLAAALPAWAGAQGSAPLQNIEEGPRLSYRHPLEAETFKGRGINAIASDIQAAGARVFTRHPGRQSAALVLAIPAKDAAQ